MTELALILGIQGAALAYAWVAARSIAFGDGSSQRLRRLEGALERATSVFFGKQARVVLVGSLIAAVLLVGLHTAAEAPSPQLGVAHGALTRVMSLMAGVALTLAAAYLALRLNVRASMQLAVGDGFGMDRTLRLAVRAGGASSLVCEALSLSGLVLAFGAVFAVAGGTTLPRDSALSLAREVVSLLTAFPLGAAVAALVLQRASGAYQTASTLGADLAGARETALVYEDSRNPALVGGVAGDHLSESASRAAFLFLMAATAHVSVLALGLAAVQADALPTVTLAFLPLLVRAFFLLATLFAFSAVRTEELTSPNSGLLRGHLSATCIGLSGLLGCCMWLAREQVLHLFAAGLVATLVAVLVALPVWAHVFRRTTSLREASDALRSGTGSVALSSFGAGLEATLLPTLTLGLGASLVWQLGSSTGLASGGLWASLVGWAALFGLSPFAFAVSGVATLGAAARGTAALGALGSDVRRRTQRFDEIHISTASARAQLNTASAATALLCALAIPVLASAPFDVNLGILEPAITWSGALGVALMLAYTGSCTRAGVRGAREVALEVERQLRGFPREHGVLKIPSDFAPSYRMCVDLSARAALRHLAPYTFGALAVPFALAFGLKLAYGTTENSVALRALSSFVLFATVTGFAAASAIDAARATLSFIRRFARTQNPPESKPSPTHGSVSDVLGTSAGPAALVLLVAMAAVGLALAPFLRT